MNLSKPLAVAVAMALSSHAFAQTQSASPTTPKDIETLETIIVTGSNIKGVDLAKSQPVVVITAQDIKESGAISVTDLISKISETGGGTGNFSTTSSGARQADSPAGSAGISLRGLGTASTLTLINGRRIAASSFANGSQNFIDVNMIPLSAVDRVEILTTGASAIYGADAVAGVVNFVLRKDFDGGLVSLSTGESEASSNDSRNNANLVWGKSGEKGRALVVVDLYQKAALYDRDRRSTANSPRPSRQGTFASFNNANFSVDDVVEASCPASLRHDDNPLPSGPDGEYCEFNRNAFTATDPARKSISVLGSFGYNFSENLEFFSDISYGRNTATASTEGAPWDAEISGTHPNISAGLVTALGFNPAIEGLYAFGRFNELRTVEVKTNAWRALGGLKGTVGAWDWESALSFSQSKSNQEALAGIYNRRRFEAALIGTLCNDGTISTNATTPCAPGTTRIFYNPFNGGTNNSPELLELLDEDVNRKGQSKLYSWDAKFNGALGKIGDRDIQWAFGTEVRREEITDEPSRLATADPVTGIVPVIGFGSTAADASRTSYAFFAEALLPMTETFEVRLAGRYDHYSDFGGDFNPAASFRWQPNKSFLIRGGWNSSFRAPSLAQVGAGTTLSSGVLPCPVGGEFSTSLCGGSTSERSYLSEIYGNPDLKPETANAWYLGSVFNAGDNTTFSLDYWNFNNKNLVDIDAFELFRRAATDPSLVAARDALPSGRVGIETNNGTFNSRIRNVQLELINIGVQKTDGVDVSVTHDWDAGEAGRFRFYFDTTYTRSFERSESCDSLRPAPRRGVGACINGQRLADRAGEFRYPEWLSTVGARWRYKDFSTSLSAKYTSSYYDDDQRQNVPLGSKVASSTIFDLNVGWTLSKEQYLAFNVRNLFDREPPAALGSTAGVDFFNHSSMGRFYSVSYEYRF
jgi:iron complex outermembrane recepter protein